ncbi:sigma 54-interacting transcriptional regulator [Paradesulfitobacterium aromaticivorans]
MTLELFTIKEFVQQIVEAIATVLGIEVMVFDPARNIVAGTGVTKIEIGARYNESSLTGTILTNGHPLIAREPGHSSECQECFRYGTCPYLTVVAYPIKVDNEILGSFCLVATNEFQKARILADEDVLIRFLEKAALLIGSAINERAIREQLNLLIRRYDNVVNSVHEGIIATDESGMIIHLNNSAIEMLGIEAGAILQKHITNIFPDFRLSMPELLERKKIELEVGYQESSQRRKKFFLATVIPIIGDGGAVIKGATVSMRNLKEVQSYAAKLVGTYSKYNFRDIIGDSKEIVYVKNKLEKAAVTDSTILIRGESGTGKELFAHAVHSASYRKKGPFIAINCSAIPESLMESEFFGYEEGAFTGAKRGGKPGKFELAAGGTLFLDEIGDMPLHLQSKLLRVLETHSIERVGGIEPIATDVRIIAATNRNLEEMVERREFRGDLYYRLSVIPVFIPPLRERKQDILLLIEYFLDKYSKIMNRGVQRLDPDTLHTLIHYRWPGNVRELQNAIEYAISMSEIAQPILPEHLPQRILMAAGVYNYHDPKASELISKSKSLDEEQLTPAAKLKSVELEIIREALNKFGNSTTAKEQAAKYLGISLATLYRRLKEIG